MIARSKGADAYRRVDVQSRSPLELVVMLYDAAIGNLTEASLADARQDIPARAAAISKALAIVAELHTTLNLADGGTVAAELDRLYTYVSQRLVDVTMKRDSSGLKEASKMLATIRDAWQQISAERTAVAS